MTPEEEEVIAVARSLARLLRLGITPVGTLALLEERLRAVERQQHEDQRLGVGASAWAHMVGIEKRVKSLEANVKDHESEIGALQGHTHFVDQPNTVKTSEPTSEPYR
jgi:hypothetical protein